MADWKKNWKLRFAAVAVLAIMLTACGKSSFQIVINKELNAVITAENAAVNSGGSTGTFVVQEGDIVILEPDLEKGKIKVQFTPFAVAGDIDADVRELTTPGEPETEVEISGSESVECRPPAGDYMINATVTEKASGTVIIVPGGRNISTR